MKNIIGIPKNENMNLQKNLDDQLKNVISKNDCDYMIELIQKGANVNQTNEYGFTALHEFCLNKNIEGVKLCILKKANVNVKTNFFKNTPLNLAIRNNYYKFCKLLLKNGADPTIKDRNRHNALWYAKKFGNQKFIDLIKSYLPKKN